MDFGHRQYDPQLGRFLSVDPLADKYGQARFSAYAAMGNAPQQMIDPNGLMPLAPGDYNVPILMPTGAGYGGPSSIFETFDRALRNVLNDWKNPFESLDQKMLLDDVIASIGGGGSGSSNASDPAGGSSSSANSSAAQQATTGADASNAGDGGANNSSTQDKVLFFSNEKEAYSYIVENTNKNKDGSDLPRPIENFAFVTKDGVYVLPTSGQDIDGNDFRNYGNSAEWRVLEYKIDKNGMRIKHKNKWSKVLATVHTHPGVGGMGSGSHSWEDRGFTNMSKTMSIVFSTIQAFGMVPNEGRSVNFAPVSDLTKGTISIINHYKYLYNYIKSNQ